MNKTMMATAMAAAVLATAPANAVTVTSVRIDTLITDYLQVAELQLFANGVNVALGKVATASSTGFVFGGDPVPSKAVDGSTNGNYPNIFHSGVQDGSDFLTVDLGGAFDVTSIAIFGRTDACCTFRDLYGFTLFNGATVVRTGTLDARDTSFAAAAVPEPAAWSLMIAGVGLVGGAMRRRTVRTAVSFG